LSAFLCLQPGDIVLTRSRTGVLGPLIRWFQARPNDPAYFNHVGVIVSYGTESTAILVEALWHVRALTLWKAYGPPAGAGRPVIAIYRPRMDAVRCQAVATEVLKYVGRRYGWWQLLLQAADWWVSKQRGREVYAFRRLDLGDRVICSQLIGRGFARAAWTFGVPPGAIPNPDDIHDDTQVRPSLYETTFGPAVLGGEA